MRMGDLKKSDRLSSLGMYFDLVDVTAVLCGLPSSLWQDASVMTFPLLRIVL
jgi:hypothetical protein